MTQEPTHDPHLFIYPYGDQSKPPLFEVRRTKLYSGYDDESGDVEPLVSVESYPADDSIGLPDKEVTAWGVYSFVLVDETTNIYEQEWVADFAEREKATAYATWEAWGRNLG